jgi:hypothetical protein
MLKNGRQWVTANHGHLTHLIFVPPHSVVIDSPRPSAKIVPPETMSLNHCDNPGVPKLERPH